MKQLFIAAGIALLSLSVGAQEAAIRKNLTERLPNLPKIDEVRATWQFYRDRRPDAYEEIVRP
jgi:hypothetical protein